MGQAVARWADIDSHSTHGNRWAQASSPALSGTAFRQPQAGTPAANDPLDAHRPSPTAHRPPPTACRLPLPRSSAPLPILAAILFVATFPFQAAPAMASAIPSGPGDEKEEMNRPIVEIRDRLLLTNPLGRSLNDFYYRYTLYAARSVDADDIGLLHSLISLSLIPIVEVLTRSTFFCAAAFVWIGFLLIGPAKALLKLKAQWTIAGILFVGSFLATLLVLRASSPEEAERDRCIADIRSQATQGISPRGYLNHPDAEVRYEAAYRLSESPTGADFASLASSLGDRDLRVRMWACRALGRLADPRAIPHLGRLLHDPEFNVRCQATWALGRIGTPVAVEFLNRAWERERHIYVRSYLHDTLGR